MNVGDVVMSRIYVRDADEFGDMYLHAIPGTVGICIARVEWGATDVSYTISWGVCASGGVCDVGERDVDVVDSYKISEE